MLVKEAFSKAWGTGIGKLSFQDIEVLTNEAGAPVVTKAPHPSTSDVCQYPHANETALRKSCWRMNNARDSDSLRESLEKGGSGNGRFNP